MQNKRAILIANGKVKSLLHVRKMIGSDDTLIAVDGGYKLFRNLDLVPHFLIGDLDSISARDVREARYRGIEIIQYPIRKNESDLELAVTFAIKRGFFKIIIVGGTGGRSDHAQVNLGLLLRSTEKIDIRFNDGQEEIFLVRRKMMIIGNPGDIVSLVPYGTLIHGVKTNGLAYALNNETLYPDQTRGLSNILLSESATVSLKSGNLLCFHIFKGNSNE